MSSEWPTTTLPVDKDWLVQIINSTCPGSTGVLKSYSCTHTPPGTGYVSDITRVVLNWDETASQGVKCLPKSIIIKVPTSTKIVEVSKMMGDVFQDGSLLQRVHNQEIAAYNYFASEKFDGPPPIPLAKCFFKKERTDSDEGIIILEDLSSEGRILEREEPLSREQLFLLIDHIANLQSFGFKNPNYKQHITKLDVPGFNGILAKQFDDMVKELKELIPSFPHSPQWFQEMLDKAVVDLEIRNSNNPRGYTPVLAHGDCNPNNILWERDPTNTTAKVIAFLDLQVTGPSNAADDICNIVLFKMSAAERRRLETEVVETFYQKLTGLIEQNKNLEFTLTIDEVKKVYRKQLCFLAIKSLPTVANILCKMSLPEEIAAPIVEPYVSAIEDLEKVWA